MYNEQLNLGASLENHKAFSSPAFKIKNKALSTSTISEKTPSVPYFVLLKGMGQERTKWGDRESRKQARRVPRTRDTRGGKHGQPGSRRQEVELGKQETNDRCRS
jgi:hypothetical protein